MPAKRSRPPVARKAAAPRRAKSPRVVAAPAGKGAIWQLQDAKARFSEVVNRAQAGEAQTITRHGKPVAVVLSPEIYHRFRPRRSLVETLLSCPVKGIIPDRSKEYPRDLHL